MAGFYWYERNPQLFNDEKQAMNLYFPNFVLDRLADGRICWVGNLNPRGADALPLSMMMVLMFTGIQCRQRIGIVKF